MTCEQFDQWLDAFLDGGLAPVQQHEMDAHLAGCATCRTHAAEMRAVLAAATALPRSIMPPRDLWAEISARLPARRVVQARQSAPWSRWVPLAAAALLLIAVTATVTYRLARPTVPDPVGVATAPVAVAGFAADREYVLAAEDLERVLAEGRGRLAPSTVELLERNLALIDAAITEARAALEADPENADLRALLWGAHRQKLDLLDRATRLTRS
jgi:anti-sigma factor RsiW